MQRDDQIPRCPYSYSVRVTFRTIGGTGKKEIMHDACHGQISELDLGVGQMQVHIRAISGHPV
jgi:hypothetical protein